MLIRRPFRTCSMVLLPGDDMEIVPTVAMNQRLQFIGTAEGTYHSRFLTGVANVSELPAHRQEPPTAFFVNLAGVSLLAIHVCLVALHGPFDVRQPDASILDAAVETSEAKLQPQLAKSAGLPPRQIRNVFCLGCLVG